MHKRNTRHRGFLNGLNMGLMSGALILALQGCGEDPQQLFETAQFEEKQRNLTHAQELYERIIRDYPESKMAQQAQVRLKALKEAGQ